MRRNPDERLRELERDAATGGQEAQAAFLTARMRAGEVSREEVMSSSRQGDEIALKALGLELGDLQVLDAVGRTKSGKLRNITGSNGRRVIQAWYRARGYAEDQWGSLRKGNRRIKFKTRVYEVFKGSPGKWFKVDSCSYAQKAKELTAQAQQRFEGGEAVKKHHLQQEKQTQRAEKQRSKKKTQELVLRAASVRASVQLEPEARREIVLDKDAHAQFWKHVFATPDHGLPPGTTREVLDSRLSMDRPPIPYLGTTRLRIPAPEEYSWDDAQLGLPVTVRKSRHYRSVEIQIGNLWVDPFSGAVSKETFFRAPGEDRTGISGGVTVIRTEHSRLVTGILYMIISSSPRKGMGTRMLRAWCRIMRGYGVRVWVARAVGDEGASFFNELEARGEIRVLNRRSNNDWVVECEGALDDPRQQLLFPRRPNPEPAKHLPAPVHAALPRRSSFELLVTGRAPLVYLPDGVDEVPQARAAMLSLLTKPPLEGGLATPDAWEDLLATLGRRARVFVVTRDGERWEVLDVEFDPGGYTGQLRVRHQGRLARAGERLVDLQDAYGYMIPIVEYRPVRR